MPRNAQKHAVVTRNIFSFFFSHEERKGKQREGASNGKKMTNKAWVTCNERETNTLLTKREKLKK